MGEAERSRHISWWQKTRTLLRSEKCELAEASRVVQFARLSANRLCVEFLLRKRWKVFVVRFLCEHNETNMRRVLFSFVLLQHTSSSRTRVSVITREMNGSGWIL